MNRYKQLFKESRYKIHDFKKGQIVEIDPHAEVAYSYKHGYVPSKWLKNMTWLVDDIEYDSGMINIHSLDPIPGGGEIGGACSFVYYEDIIKIVKQTKV